MKKPGGEGVCAGAGCHVKQSQAVGGEGWLHVEGSCGCKCGGHGSHGPMGLGGGLGTLTSAAGHS